MGRFIYWITNCILKNNRGCHSFCGICPHYDTCKYDVALSNDYVAPIYGTERRL